MIARVSSSSTSGMAPTREWRERAAGTILCPRCGRFDRRWYPRPVDVDLLEWEDGPILLSGFRAGLSLYRSDFIEQVATFMRDFVIGRCYEKGRLVARYVTAYSLRYVVEHRDEKTKYRRCAECGLFTTDVILPPGYVLRQELPPGLVYSGSVGGIYLDANLCDGVNWSRYPDVQLHRFEVRDTPLPGWRSRDDPDIVEWGEACKQAEKEMRQRRDEWLDKWLKPPQV